MRHLILFATLPIIFFSSAATAVDWPCRNATDQHRVTGAVGEFRQSGTNPIRFHRGTDITDNDRTVLAINSGQVVRTATNNFWTQNIRVGDVYYFHINFIANNGQQVNPGDVIGTMRTDGPVHVHLQQAGTNYLDHELNPFVDNSDPIIGGYSFRKNGHNFNTNQATLNANQLYGKIDIVVNAHDSRLDASGNDDGGAVAPYRIAADIYDSNGDLVDTFYYLTFDRYPADNNVATQIFGVNSGTATFNWVITNHPFTAPHDRYWNTRQRTGIVENWSGSTNLDARLNAEARFPDGNYTVALSARDVDNDNSYNEAIRNVDVVLDNFAPYLESLQVLENDTTVKYHAYWPDSIDVNGDLVDSVIAANDSINVAGPWTIRLGFSEAMNTGESPMIKVGGVSLKGSGQWSSDSRTCSFTTETYPIGCIPTEGSRNVSVAAVDLAGHPLDATPKTIGARGSNGSISGYDSGPDLSHRILIRFDTEVRTVRYDFGYRSKILPAMLTGSAYNDSDSVRLSRDRFIAEVPDGTRQPRFSQDGRRIIVHEGPSFDTDPNSGFRINFRTGDIVSFDLQTGARTVLFASNDLGPYPIIAFLDVGRVSDRIAVGAWKDGNTWKPHIMNGTTLDVVPEFVEGANVAWSKGETEVLTSCSVGPPGLTWPSDVGYGFSTYLSGTYNALQISGVSGGSRIVYSAAPNGNYAGNMYVNWSSETTSLIAFTSLEEDVHFLDLEGRPVPSDTFLFIPVLLGRSEGLVGGDGHIDIRFLHGGTSVFFDIDHRDARYHGVSYTAAKIAYIAERFETDEKTELRVVGAADYHLNEGEVITPFFEFCNLKEVSHFQMLDVAGSGSATFHTADGDSWQPMDEFDESGAMTGRVQFRITLSRNANSDDAGIGGIQFDYVGTPLTEPALAPRTAFAAIALSPDPSTANPDWTDLSAEFESAAARGSTRECYVAPPNMAFRHPLGYARWWPWIGSHFRTVNAPEEHELPIALRPRARETLMRFLGAGYGWTPVTMTGRSSALLLPGRYAVMVKLDSHLPVSIGRQPGHHLLLWWNASEWNHGFVDTRRAIETIVSRDAFLDTVSSASEAASRLATGDYDALIIMGTDANLSQDVRDRFESEHGHIFGEFVCDVSKVAPDRMAAFLLKQLR